MISISIPLTLCLAIAAGIFLIILLAAVKIKKFQKIFDYDKLTGLYSLEKFKRESKKKILKVPENEYSIICIDVENFQHLSDSLGRQAANSVLKAIGKHYMDNPPPDSIMCRRYADNFMLLLHTTFGPIIEDQVLSLLNIVSTLGNVIPLHYTLEFSTGVYVISKPNEDMELMMHKANLARLAGKNSIHPGRISFYDDEMTTNTEHEREILFDMNRAFDSGEFIPYYQPKFRFSDGKIIGAEALVRWKHHKKGIIPPIQFVPLFEKNGFITKIDTSIFEATCKFLDRWNRSGPNGSCPQPLTISCNLSRYQLYNPNFVREYSQIFERYDIAPSKIEIELTESLMMDNKQRLLRAMNEIRRAGFEISIDDFGSGFSSLSLLKDIPANVIKLDKEFLSNTTGKNQEDENSIIKDNIIVTSVIEMAKKLHMSTVAEGVEEENQAALLRKMGCDIAQGFFYAKPMCEEDFFQLLKSNIN